jgi:hypothetical protein
MEAVTDASFNLGWPGLIWGDHGHPGPPLEPPLVVGSEKIRI